MTVDPKVGMWLSVLAAIILFLAAAPASLADVFGAVPAGKIVSIATLSGGIISAVNAVLHVIPAPAGTKYMLGPK
jgi:uncharacterized membrane protein